MADLKALSEEMAKLKRQPETVLYISGYRDYDDLSGLDDYKQIKTADQRQQLEEYRISFINWTRYRAILPIMTSQLKRLADFI